MPCSSRLRSPAALRFCCAAAALGLLLGLVGCSSTRSRAQPAASPVVREIVCPPRQAVCEAPEPAPCPERAYLPRLEPLDLSGVQVVKPIAFTLLDDAQHYYARPTLPVLLAGLGTGAVLANTPLDEEFQDWYQEDVRNSGTNRLADGVKWLGDGWYTMPILTGTLLLGRLHENRPYGPGLELWSDRSIRATVVGVPALLLAQSAIGASRPGEASWGANWQPFQDENGASGHAYIAAVPFITAAQMTSDPYAKAGWYFASTLGGWSRINDDAHYTSQVVIGWAMAYAACAAISRADGCPPAIEVLPVPIQDGVGVGLVLRR